MHVSVLGKDFKRLHEADVKFPFATNSFRPADFAFTNDGVLLLLVVEHEIKPPYYNAYADPVTYAEKVRLFGYNQSTGSVYEIALDAEEFRNIVSPKFVTDNTGHVFLTGAVFSKRPSGNFPRPNKILAFQLNGASSSKITRYAVDIDALRERPEMKKLYMGNLRLAHLVPVGDKRMLFVLNSDAENLKPAGISANVIGVCTDEHAVVNYVFAYKGTAGVLIKADRKAYFLHDGNINSVVKNKPELLESYKDGERVGAMLTTVKLDDGSLSTQWLLDKKLVGDHYPVIHRALLLDQNTVLVKGINGLNLTRVVFATVTLP
jgi:hypothetical protein